MKAKAMPKAVRHAKPVRKHPKAKAHMRRPVVPAGKEIVAPAAPEPQMVETTIATLDGPVEVMVMVPEPVVDVFEVLEFGVAGDET